MKSKFCLLVLLAVFTSSIFIASCTSESKRPINKVSMAVDAGVLEFFSDDERRKKLLRYLATSGLWMVSDYDSINMSFARSGIDYGVWKNGYVASLLISENFFTSLKDVYAQNLILDIQSMGPGVVSGTEMFYGAGAVEKGDDRSYLAVQLYIPSDKDKPLTDKQVNSGVREIEIPVEITNDKNRKLQKWCHSVVNLQAHDLGLVVQESSFDPERKDTKEAIQFVMMQLEDIAKRIESGSGLDRSILPLNNIRRGESSVRIGACLHGYQNPGKPGWLKLKLNPVSKKDTGHSKTDAGKNWSSKVLSGWSEDPEEKFFFALPYNLEGDKINNIMKYDLELKFTPLNGTEDVVILSQPGRREFSSE